MLNENAKKWVDALRSGEYKQTSFMLRGGDAFCCLGVACDVAIKNGISLRISFGPSGLTTYDNCSSGLPDVVREWLGLRGSLGTFVGSSLVALNDVKKCSFTEIADQIEGEPEGLFVEEKNG